MEVNPLIPIGERIEVDKSKIENLLPNKLMDDGWRLMEDADG